MNALFKKKILLKAVSSIISFTFLFTSTLANMSFAKEGSAPAAGSSKTQSANQAGANYTPALNAAGLNAASFGATAASLPSLATAAAISSFQVDPSSGTGVSSIPIVTPPARAGIGPNIAITYSSVAKNGLVGVGWNLNLGTIERSTKNGTPHYDNTDTFIFNMGGQEELVPIGSGEYRPKIESGFMKFEFDGNTWKATDKSGKKYYFGLAQNERIVSWGSNVFAWGLTKIVDTNGNYLLVEYYADNTLRPSLIKYTGNEITNLLPAHRIVFAYETRLDGTTSYRSGAMISFIKRLNEIQIYSNNERVRKYYFGYTYHYKTGRSLLKEVTVYGKDDQLSLPPVTFTYQDDRAFEYQQFQTEIDLTKPGDNLWKCRFSGGFDRGHENFGPLPPPAFDVNWGQIYTQASGGPGYNLPNIIGGIVIVGNEASSWNIKPDGDLSFSSHQDTANWFWTYLYVDNDKELSIPMTAGDGVVGVYINGDYANRTSGPWKLKKGFNLIDITAYHQHQSFSVNLNKGIVNEVRMMNSSQILTPQLAGDYNGDGFTDLGAFDWRDGTWKITLSNGADFLPEETWITNFGKDTMPTAPLLGDYDGDGLVDIAVFIPRDGNWHVALSTGSAFVDKGVWLSNGSSVNKEPISGDFNGDGKSDIGWYDADAGNWYIALSEGNKFSSDNTAWMNNFKTGKPYTADFNGDGLTDICLFDKTDGSWRVILSHGRGFSYYGHNGMTGFAIGQEKIFITDVNADGLADIGYLDTNSSCLRAAFGDGLRFTQQMNILEEMSLNETDLILQMADFNGDGIADPFLFSPATQKRNWALSTGNAPELLSEIGNGLGGKLKVFYMPSTYYDNKTQDNKNGLPFAMQTVSKTITSDGLGNSYTTYYTYTGGLYDTQNKEFRGFRSTKVADDEGNITETYMYQDNILKGRPYLTQTKDIDGNIYTKATSTWDFKEIYPGVYYAYLTKQESFTYDGGQDYKETRMVINKYDDYGNPTEVINEGDVDVAGDEKTQVTEYVYNTANWIMSLPKHTYLLDANRNIITQKWFYYDNGSLDSPPQKGRLTKEEVEIYNPLTLERKKAVSQITYNDYGNVISVIDSLNNVIATEYETVSYTYPQRTINALTQAVTSKYDLGTGQLLETTEPNGLTSINIYDDLGRLQEIKQKYAAQEITRSVYEYDFSILPIKVTQKQVVSESNPPDYFIVYSFYDGLGRLIQTKSPAEDNLKQVISDTVRFDSKGRVKEKFFFYFSNLPNETTKSKYIPPDYGQPKTTFSYDLLGRVVRITNPDESYFTTEYSKWTVMKTDENNNKKKEYYDAYGNIVKVEEYNDSNIYTTTYQYNAQGNLTKIIDNQDNATEIIYDSLGRKIRMDDPDMGIWTYEYDLGGNLKKQTDAKGQTIEFAYDKLNRLQTKTISAPAQSSSSSKAVKVTEGNITYIYEPNKSLVLLGAGSTKTVTYIYDDLNKENCIGKLSKVVDPSGETDFYYDSFGREIKSTKAIGISLYTVERTYDLLDRLTSLKYPDGEIVNYEYNPSGAIKKVYSSSRAYINNIEYSATGQLTKIEYGNGIITNYQYNPLTLRLSHLTSQSPAKQLQDLQYEFDNIGNVTHITDSVNTATQTFQYDDLNRLTQAIGAYGIFNYEYDSIGNMLKNRGAVCTYGQDGRKPHALTSTSDGLRLIYDENGNLTQKGNQFLYYDAENRLIKTEAAQKARIEVNLSKGWNAFSLPVKPANNKVSSVLYSLAYGKDYDQLIKYDSTVKTYKHYLRDPDFDEFSTMDYLSSYLINITNPDGVKLHLIGDIPQSQETIPLKQGWNFIGAPFLEQKTVEQEFSGLQFSADYDQVSRHNNVTKLFDNYNKASGDTLSSLNPGDGTAVYCLRDKTWTTPVTAQAINVEFVYDGDGGRVKKITPSSTTTYVGSLYEVTNTVSTKHIFAGSNRVCSVESSGNIYFIHGDHLGGSNLVTDKDGNQISLTEYTPYGTVSVQKGSDVTNYKFTGKELDAPTGLYYYGARYYDPELGRFTTPDAIIQAPYDPQSLNRYSYCRNNPINYTDPTGNKWSWKKFWNSFAGGFVGGLIFSILTLGYGAPLWVAGMAAGFAGGALTGGLNGGWKGALYGGLMGGALGGIGGFGTQTFGSSFGYGLLAAGAISSAATGNLDSFAGGLIGGYVGSQVGAGVFSYYKDHLSITNPEGRLKDNIVEGRGIYQTHNDMLKVANTMGRRVVGTETRGFIADIVRGGMQMMFKNSLASRDFAQFILDNPGTTYNLHSEMTLTAAGAAQTLAASGSQAVGSHFNLYSPFYNQSYAQSTFNAIGSTFNWVPPNLADSSGFFAMSNPLLAPIYGALGIVTLEHFHGYETYQH